MTSRHTAALLLALLAPAVAAAAAPPTGDRPADLGPPQRLAFEPGPARGGGTTLAGADARHQLLVTGHYAGGKARDLTRAVKYEVKPAGVARVDATGLVAPLKEGKATVRATAGALSAEAALTVTRLEKDVPVNFASEVVPIFTKFGCNAGGCHGKASGQNGFKLSLLGFEPEEDYEYLVKEGRGRRLFPAAPEHSLLVRKATGQAAHGGGKKIDPESPFYRLLVRWIAQGAPY